MSKTLEEIRAALDDADRRIVDALAARHGLIAEVISAKSEDQAGQRDELHVRVYALREILRDRFVALLLAEDVALGNQTDPKRGPGPSGRTLGGFGGLPVPAARREGADREYGENDGSAVKISR